MSEDILVRLKSDKSYRDGKHGPAGHLCGCWLCDSIREIERLRALMVMLKKHTYVSGQPIIEAAFASPPTAEGNQT